MATLQTLSAGISGKSLTRLPQRERRHFLHCNECGLWYDCRSLAEVVYHDSGHNTEAVRNLPEALPDHPVRPGLRRYHHHHHVKPRRAAA